VRALTSDGYSLLFEGETATCTKGDVEIFCARIQHGLYVLDDAEVYNTEEAPESLNETMLNLWHRRLGHTNFADIQKLQSSSQGISVSCKIKTAGRRACEGCLAGKMKESFNKKSDTRSTIRVRRLHADTSGILPISIRGYRYFLLVIDDATRCT